MGLEGIYVNGNVHAAAVAQREGVKFGGQGPLRTGQGGGARKLDPELPDMLPAHRFVERRDSCARYDLIATLSNRFARRRSDANACGKRCARVATCRRRDGSRPEPYAASCVKPAGKRE